MKKLTHFDDKGNATMVDVTDKKVTDREAIATGYIGISKDCYERIDNKSIAKGDVLAVAQVAGIMGAKKTSELIPLCHILNLTKVAIEWQMIGARPEDIVNAGDKDKIRYWINCRCIVRCTGKTGVEMEALTGVSTALLTVYDMCKAIDKKMIIDGITLVKKSGGKSGDFRNDNLTLM